MQKILLIICFISIRITKCYLFSVILSIYNTGRYLDDSIGSLLNQTIGIKKIQIILVNDGSSDNSENVCLKYKILFKNNIIYIKTEHSGVSKARNIGLSLAKGKYINFLDSDDKWDSQAFKYINLFFKFNKNIDLIGTRIKFFESKNGYHFLDYKFSKTRVVNLTEEYNCIQLSAASSFFRKTSLKQNKFEENILFGEDCRFISNILLIKPLFGIIREVIYYYRRRADSTSAIQNTEKNIEYYFSTINNVQQYLINKSINLYNKIVPFIQFYIAYEIVFRISSLAFKFLDLFNYNKYCDLIENLLKQIEDKYILEQQVLSRLKIYVLSKKYNKDMRYNIKLIRGNFIYSKYNLINPKRNKDIIIWRIFEIKNDIIHLEGEDRFWLPREKFYYFCKIGNKKFFPKYSFYSGYDFLTMYGLAEKGRLIFFDLKIDIKDMQYIHFYISYMNKNIEIFPTLGPLTHIPPIKYSYYVTEKYLITNNNKNLIIYPYNEYLAISLEIKYCSELRKQQKDKIINIRKNIIKYKKKLKAYKSSQIWIINDRKDQAGDNGEYFFRYLNKKRPKGINYYFAIKKNCSDYKRMKKYGKVINLDSIFYLNKFLTADKIISSIEDSWVNNPFGEDGNYIRDFYNFDLIYLSKGILKDDLSVYLNKIKKQFDILITSSKFEFNSLLHSNYGYNKNNIITSGLPRLDHLKSLQRQISIEKIILVFPTWRRYIKGTRDLITDKKIGSNYFLNSKYFKFYNNLINEPQLLGIMKEYNFTGILCLHPNFSAQWKYFKQNDIFEVKEKCFIQNLLTKASLLITDYSSIFFDFGYIEKPIIYTQFDYEEYRQKHFHQGYFDYKSDGFGPICYDLECTINKIIYEIKNRCQLKKYYLTRIKRFFMFFDEKNCYRTFIGILKMKHMNIYQIEKNMLFLIITFIIFIMLKKMNKNLYCFLNIYYIYLYLNINQKQI